MRQLRLDGTEVSEKETSEWGTFRDSLRAPVHSWFTYPAVFSYKAVEHSLELANLTPGKSTIYDPFMGSGTTNLVAKGLGYNSAGVEAHPFVIDITKTKMQWKVSRAEIRDFIETIPTLIGPIPSASMLTSDNSNHFPELVCKCFLPDALYSMRQIRDGINNASNLSQSSARFLRTALICTLRDVSIAATGWPYIAPDKIKITSMSKDAVNTYTARVWKMLDDLDAIQRSASTIRSKHKLILGSSTKSGLSAETIDHIFTSPPYLNNFDYADRTRLEMYFMGDADNWAEISKKVRTKLMTSATTQISRLDSRYELSDDIGMTSPRVYDFLSEAKEKLGILRNQKSGKKSYDLMVTGYFNDIYQILRDNYRVLKPGSQALYILGDSAPYGVHIPTDELIGEIGLGLGFASCEIEVLRLRGGKWASNPQRHSVPLRESIVKMKK